MEEKIRMEHLEGEEVVKLRREKSYHIIKELEKWCKEEYGHTVDKSPIAKAIFYMYTRFENCPDMSMTHSSALTIIRWSVL